jgi:hypothetical protein
MAENGPAPGGAGATISEHPDQSYPGKLTDLCLHRRSGPGVLVTRKNTLLRVEKRVQPVFPLGRNRMGPLPRNRVVPFLRNQRVQSLEILQQERRLEASGLRQARMTSAEDDLFPPRDCR